MRTQELSGFVACLFLASACRGIPVNERQDLELSAVASPLIDSSDRPAAPSRPFHPTEGGIIVIDSVALRPVVVAKGDSMRTGVVTTYQGGRYHPETIRALADDSIVLAASARSIIATSPGIGTRLMLDFQEITPNDLPALAALVRAIHAEASARGTGRPLGIVVPPGDTVSYPTVVLARLAELIVVRLHGEHRAGTSPGPSATREFIAREIGIRSRAMGTSRLVAELPLFGYRWERDGAARPITYLEARALVVGEAGVFRRDPASRFLTATGRDGWTVWVPDAASVEFMIAAVRQRGINRIVLAGTNGADPGVRLYQTSLRR